ncbi:hypothetical protein [Nocardia aurea]|uniref:ANTAR domain-containing protein n=1 Tax=Nocardia aurea TaxID=2144174 RepID=A0ABV3G4Y1_9NOCA
MANRNSKTSRTTGQATHAARCVGQGQWIVSFLPGRTLSSDQAHAALAVADELDTLRSISTSLGLTVLELVGLAMMDCSEQRAFAHPTAVQVPWVGQER